MNCERCQTELEDFLYGELSERHAGEMRAHLTACAECAAVRDDLERENQLFAQFYEQTAVEPAGEMWEAIRARIAAEPARQIQTEAKHPEAKRGKPGWWPSLAMGLFGSARSSMLRQAALAVLLVALSVTATVLLMRRGDSNQNLAQNSEKQVVAPPPQTTMTPAPVPSPTTDVPRGPERPPTPLPNRPALREPVQPRQLSDQELLVRQLVKAEHEYQGAIKMLDRAIAKRRDSIEPEAFKQYESSLALINDSIAQSKHALRQRPDDLVTGQFLLAAYAKKVELMQTIAMN